MPTYFKRVISLITLFAFVFTMVLPDALAAGSISKNPFEQIQIADNVKTIPVFNVDTFSLPDGLGEVQFFHKGSSGKTVIHIQDAHCNYFAQKRVGDILNYLAEEFDINIANLEGGAGAYDLKVFDVIKGKKVKEQVTDHFVETGEISGAEFYAINNPDKMQLWGIENKELYLSNLKVYKDHLSHKEKIEVYLAELTHILNDLKRHIYPEDLLKVDMAFNAYKASNMEFREYLEILAREASAIGIDIKQHKNLERLIRAMELEKGTDFEKASKERSRLIDALRERLSKNEIDELVKKILDLKDQAITERSFYEYLFRRAKEAGIKEEEFSKLADYVSYLSVYETVDKSLVMGELDLLEHEIIKKLAKSDIQLELNDLSRDLAIMKNIFKISLTRRDYEYYLRNKSSFYTSNYTRFIEKNAVKYGITAKLSKDVSRLDGYLADMLKFYEYSFKRDEAFLKNMVFSGHVARPTAHVTRNDGRETRDNDRRETTHEPQTPKPEIRATSHKPQVTILITGGFHTENLCELFKKEGISYVSILPKFVTEERYKNPYFDLLAGKTNVIERKLNFVLARISNLAIASKLAPLLAEEVYSKNGIGVFKAAVIVWQKIVELKGQDAAGKSLENIYLSEDGNNLVVIFKNGEIIEIDRENLHNEGVILEEDTAGINRGTLNVRDPMGIPEVILSKMVWIRKLYNKIFKVDGENFIMKVYYDDKAMFYPYTISLRRFSDGREVGNHEFNIADNRQITGGMLKINRNIEGVSYRGRGLAQLIIDQLVDVFPWVVMKERIVNKKTLRDLYEGKRFEDTYIGHIFKKWKIIEIGFRDKKGRYHEGLEDLPKFISLRSLIAGVSKAGIEVVLEPKENGQEKGGITPKHPADSKGKLGGNSEGTAVTQWLKRITKNMNPWVRALLVAPFVEEFIYRGLPLAVTKLKFLESVNLGIFLLVVAAVIFVAHHKYTRRAPPTFKRLFKWYLAPVAVAVMNVIVVPVLINHIPFLPHNILTFLGFSIAVHSLVNLVVLLSKPWWDLNPAMIKKKPEDKGSTLLVTKKGIRHRNKADVDFTLPENRFGVQGINPVDILISVSREELGYEPIVSVIGSMSYVLTKEGTPDWDVISDLDLRVHTRGDVSSDRAEKIKDRYFKVLRKKAIEALMEKQGITRAVARAKVPVCPPHVERAEWYIREQNRGKKYRIGVLLIDEEQLFNGESNVDSYRLIDLFFGNIGRLDELLNKVGTEGIIKRTTKYYRETLRQAKNMKNVFDMLDPDTKLKILKNLYQLAYIRNRERDCGWLLEAYKNLKENYDEGSFLDIYKTAIDILEIDEKELHAELAGFIDLEKTTDETVPPIDVFPVAGSQETIIANNNRILAEHGITELPGWQVTEQGAYTPILTGHVLGSSHRGIVFEAKFPATDGFFAVKVMKIPKRATVDTDERFEIVRQTALSSFMEEMATFRDLANIVSKSGQFIPDDQIIPAFYMVDLGAFPAFGMERVIGKSTATASDKELAGAANELTIPSVKRIVNAIYAKGYRAQNINIMILTEDQVLNGRHYRKGETVLLYANNFFKDKSPIDSSRITNEMRDMVTALGGRIIRAQDIFAFIDAHNKLCPEDGIEDVELNDNNGGCSNVVYHKEGRTAMKIYKRVFLDLVDYFAQTGQMPDLTYAIEQNQQLFTADASINKAQVIKEIIATAKFRGTIIASNNRILAEHGITELPGWQVIEPGTPVPILTGRVLNRGDKSVVFEAKFPDSDVLFAVKAMKLPKLGAFNGNRERYEGTIKRDAESFKKEIAFFSDLAKITKDNSDRIAADDQITPAYKAVNLGRIPAFAMEEVMGVCTMDASFKVLSEAVNGRTMESIKRITRTIYAKGYRPCDLQFMILMEDQELNGRKYYKGEAILIDVEMFFKWDKNMTEDQIEEEVENQLEVFRYNFTWAKNITSFVGAYNHVCPERTIDEVIYGDVSEALTVIYSDQNETPDAIDQLIFFDLLEYFSRTGKVPDLNYAIEMRQKLFAEPSPEGKAELIKEIIATAKSRARAKDELNEDMDKYAKEARDIYFSINPRLVTSIEKKSERKNVFVELVGGILLALSFDQYNNFDEAYEASRQAFMELTGKDIGNYESLRKFTEFVDRASSDEKAKAFAEAIGKFEACWSIWRAKTQGEFSLDGTINGNINPCSPANEKPFLDLASGVNPVSCLRNLSSERKYIFIDKNPVVAAYLNQARAILDVEDRATVLQRDVRDLKLEPESIGTIRLGNLPAYVDNDSISDSWLKMLIDSLVPGGQMIIETAGEYETWEGDELLSRIMDLSEPDTIFEYKNREFFESNTGPRWIQTLVKSRSPKKVQKKEKSIVSMNQEGQWEINANLPKTNRADNNWDGMLDGVKKVSEEIMNSNAHNMFGGEEAVINIGVSEQKTGQPLPVIFGKAALIKSKLNGKFQVYKMGDITINVFADDVNANGVNEGVEELKKEIDEFNKNGRKSEKRMITFLYNKDKKIEEDTYTVYLDGNNGETVTPIDACGMAGLALFNYFDRSEKAGGEDKLSQDVRKSAILSIAKGLAAISGKFDNESAQSIARTAFKNGKLSASGIILVRIRPVDTQEIVELWEAVSAVMKSL
ncbi:MAG: lysostaphin resistance A-like protein [Candidatus Omnitrophica bacterium]|nr:lysostaphin resistance A-like protein [Candidatus Omnitrophota bacterium]